MSVTFRQASSSSCPAVPSFGEARSSGVIPCATTSRSTHRTPHPQSTADATRRHSPTPPRGAPRRAQDAPRELLPPSPTPSTPRGRPPQPRTPSTPRSAKAAPRTAPAARAEVVLSPAKRLFLVFVWCLVCGSDKSLRISLCLTLRELLFIGQVPEVVWLCVVSCCIVV